MDMLIGKRYVYLFNIKETRTCDALYKYLGEFAYDLERQMGILVGACPIAKVKFSYVEKIALFSFIYYLYNFREDTISIMLLLTLKRLLQLITFLLEIYVLREISTTETTERILVSYSKLQIAFK